MARSVLHTPAVPSPTPRTDDFLLGRGQFPSTPGLELLAVGLVLGSFLVASTPSLGHGLVWDDLHFLDPERGSLWRRGWLREIWLRPMWWAREQGVVPPYYRPLGLTMLRLEGSPAVSHLVQVGLHGLNVGLVVRLARTLGADRLPALVAGGLFAVHPANVEVYSWLSARGDALGTTLALAGLLVLRLGREGPGRQVTFGALVFLALLAKESFVVLPLVGALVVGSSGPLLSGGVALLLWGGVFAVALETGGVVGGAPDVRHLPHGLLQVPFLLFGPTGRTAGYLPGQLPAHWLSVWVSLVVAWVWTGWSLGSREGRRDLGAVLIAFAPALLPLLVLGGRSGDRYAYFPLALLLAGVAARVQWPEGVQRKRLLALGVLILWVLGAAGARSQAAKWADPQLRDLRPGGVVVSGSR